MTGRFAAEYNLVFKGKPANKQNSITQMEGLLSTGQWPTPLYLTNGGGIVRIPMLFCPPAGVFKTSIKNGILANKIRFQFK
jgi:hypothetical protein